MESLKEIKKMVIKTIDYNIEKTKNFNTLARLKQAKKDLKYANANKTLYIIGYLKAQTKCFDGYLENINYNNYNFFLFQR